MLAGMLTGFLIGLLGWQINLIAIYRGIDRGHRAALGVGMGAATGDLCWMSLAFAGARALSTYYHEYWVYLKWVGFTVIFLAGLRIFFESRRDPVQFRQKVNLTKNFLIGLLVVGGNPAQLILWVGVIGFVLTHAAGADGPWFQYLYMGGFLIGASCWFLTLSFIVLPEIRQWTDKRFQIISRFFAAALMAGAFTLIFFDIGRVMK